MLSPTSTSAMSIERISNAVPESRAALQHDLGDAVGVLEHRHVVLRRADGGDDALADTGDDGLLGRAADEAVEVGVRTVTRAFTLSWMPSPAMPSMVFRAICPEGTSMTFGSDRGADRLLHVASGEIDGAGAGRSRA